MNEIDRQPDAPVLVTPDEIRPPETVEPGTFEPAPPTLRAFFLGDDGLRAGWSVLLYVIFVACILVSIQFAVKHLHLMPKDLRPVATRETPFSVMAVGEGTLFCAFTLAAWLMSLIEGRPFGRYGLPAKRMPSDVAIGFSWGLLCLSLLVGTMAMTHVLAFDGLLLHGAAALKYGLEWLAGFLVVGLLEEFLFRGYLQYTVSRGVAGIARAMAPDSRHTFQWGFWVAASLFSGLLFMAGHLGNEGETFSGIVSVGLAGAVFVFSLYRTGSLWWAIGFHTAWDWAQSFLYGVFDSGTMVEGHLMASHPLGKTLYSGGSAGPEGSLWCIPTFVLIFAIIHFTLPKREYPLTHDQRLPEAPLLTSIRADI